MTAVRVRFAPSPTGPLHVGGARTALYNWLHARGRGGIFVLRIDDTDRARSSPEHLEGILGGLAWLGLDWDEGPGKGGTRGPYFQGEKTARYREVAEQLLASGQAYRCFCGEERVEEGRRALVAEGGKPMYDRLCRSLAPGEARRRAAAGEECTVRFAMPEGRRVLEDLIKGSVQVDLAELDDWVMLRRDGSPLYNLCSAVDDVDMAITDVIRGEEHFYNGIKQLLVFEALGAPPPRFAHLPLILGKDRKKLSKRLAQTDLLDYRRQGYPADALVNFLALLGWGYDATTEVCTREQMLERFRIERVSTGGSMCDEEKLNWMSGVYIRAMDRLRFLESVAPFLERAGLADAATVASHRAFFANLAACEQERISCFSQLPPKVAYVFAEGVELDEAAAKVLAREPRAREVVGAFRESLGPLALPPSFPEPRGGADEAVPLPTAQGVPGPDPAAVPFLPPQALEAHARAVAAALGVKFASLVHPVRALLTGTTMGPGLFDVVYLLGRRKVLERLAAGF